MTLSVLNYSKSKDGRKTGNKFGESQANIEGFRIQSSLEGESKTQKITKGTGV